jgi:hypothetical protein
MFVLQKLVCICVLLTAYFVDSRTMTCTNQDCQMVFFLTKKPIWVNFEGLAIEATRIFYVHLLYFTTIRYIL